MPDTTIDIKTDIHSSDKEINKVNSELGRMQTHAVEAPAKLSGLWTEVIKGMGAYNLLRKAVSETVDFLKSSVDAAAEAERAQKSLENALLTSGRGAQNLSEHYKKYAESLMRATTYSDEQIKSTQALLLQMTRLDRDGIDNATKGAIGLAHVFNMDLAGATELVGRWMEGNTERIKRYGINLKDNMTLEEKRTAILARLQVYYQQAILDTDSYSGRTKQLSVAFNELKEKLGENVTKSEHLRSALASLKKMMEDATIILEHKNKSLLDVIYDYTKWIPIVKAVEAVGKSWSEELDKQARQIEANDWAVQGLTKAWDLFNKAGANPIGLLGLLYQKLLDMKKAADTKALENLKEEATAFGIKLRSETNPEVERLNKLLKDLVARGEDTPAAIEKIKKKIEELTGAGWWKDAMAQIDKITGPWMAQIKKIYEERKRLHNEALDKLDKDEHDHWEKQKDLIRQFEEERRNIAHQTYEELIREEEKLAEKQKEHAEKVKEAWQQSFQGISQFVGELGTLQQNEYNQDIERIKAKYDREKQTILDSTMNEQDKAAAIKNLETKQALDEKHIRQEAAKDQKSYAVFQAILDTASAIMATFKQFGWPLGIAPALIMAAVGAAKIAAIKAQPIPLATGFEGVVRRPTTFLVGEAGPERMSVRPEKMGDRRPITLRLPIYVGGQKVDEYIVHTVEEYGRIKGLKLGKSR